MTATAAHSSASVWVPVLLDGRAACSDCVALCNDDVPPVARLFLPRVDNFDSFDHVGRCRFHYIDNLFGDYPSLGPVLNIVGPYGLRVAA